MSFNVWQPQGAMIGSPPGFIGNPSVIYDTNPVVLVGNPNVFKMWVGLDSNGSIYYYESLDGLTSWTAYSGNPITPTNGAFFPTVYKVGNTYYLWGNSGFGTPIQAYTSTDGVTFTIQNTSSVPLGGVGTWDHNGVFQINLVDVIAGIWYAYYSGYDGTFYRLGLITSTDGINWTKSPSNPIISLSPTSNVNNSCFLKAGGVYYLYAGFFDSLPVAMQSNYRIGRWSAPTPSGPWTRLMFNSKPVPTYYLASTTELNDTALPNSGPNDQRMVVANGNIYMYYTMTANGGTELGVNAALASGYTPSQLVATYEGVMNVPFTGVPELNLTILATDTFQRANANPIGGNWTPRVAGDTAQILSDVVNASATSTPADSYWNALAWGADQWSQITVNNETNGSFLGPATRTSTSGVATSYRSILLNGTGAGANVAMQSQVAGASTNLATLAFTVSPSDTLMSANIGTSYLLYWNSQLVGIETTSTIAAGAAGFELQGTTLVTNSGISAWSGGGFAAAPAPPNPFPSASNYSVPDSRNYATFPNLSVNVGGTLTYTTPSVYSLKYWFDTLFNRTQPLPVDSRAAGASVDSRAAGAPQNSRTPGTYGPGE